MNKSFILLHIIVLAVLISVILGLSLGIVLPINLKIYNSIETVCVKNQSIINQYNCCNKICNDSLPLCDDLIKTNQSGKCCNFTGCNRFNECTIVCENCTTITNTLTYVNYLTNITIDCNNNQTCVDYYLSDYNQSCWYDKRNVGQVTFSQPAQVEWYVYYIISLLCFLTISYIIIATICIHFNLFI